MRFQELASNTITITDFRRDVDVFLDALSRDGEVMVTKNNSIMFVALDPVKYRRNPPAKDFARIAEDIKLIRDSSPRNPRIKLGYIADMREAGVSKWKK